MPKRKPPRGPAVVYSQLKPLVMPSESSRARGPTTTKVRKPVTSSVMSGVSRKSAVPDRRLWSHFSMYASNHDTHRTGMTMAW